MGVSAASLTRYALVAAFSLLEVGEDQFGFDDLDVALRVDAAFGVDHVRIAVSTDYVEQRVGFADVGEELIAEPLPLVRPGDEAGDVVEGDRVPNDLRGADSFGDLDHPLVLNRDDGDVRLDRREGIVGGLSTGLSERVEERRLAGVGHADYSDLHRLSH